MNQHAQHRSAALALAVLLTFSILASINGLATSPAPDALIAAIEGGASQPAASVDTKRPRV